MMNEFLQQPTQLPGHQEAAWKMDKMMQSLPQNGSLADQSWATEFDPGLQGPAMQKSPGLAFSTNEFARFQNASPVTAEQRAASPMTGTNGVMGYRPMMGTYGMGMMGMQQNFSPAFGMQQPQQQEMIGKGKSRMVELDDKEWEAQFAKLEQADRDALDTEANAAIEQQLNDLDRSVDAQETETDHFGDFEIIWRGIQAETKLARELAAEEDYFPDGLGIDDWNDFDGLNM